MAPPPPLLLAYTFSSQSAGVGSGFYNIITVNDNGYRLPSTILNATSTTVGFVDFNFTAATTLAGDGSAYTGTIIQELLGKTGLVVAVSVDVGGVAYGLATGDNVQLQSSSFSIVFGIRSGAAGALLGTFVPVITPIGGAAFGYTLGSLAGSELSKRIGNPNQGIVPDSYFPQIDTGSTSGALAISPVLPASPAGVYELPANLGGGQDYGLGGQYGPGIPSTPTLPFFASLANTNDLPAESDAANSGVLWELNDQGQPIGAPVTWQDSSSGGNDAPSSSGGLSDVATGLSNAFDSTLSGVGSVVSQLFGVASASANELQANASNLDSGGAPEPGIPQISTVLITLGEPLGASSSATRLAIVAPARSTGSGAPTTRRALFLTFLFKAVATGKPPATSRANSCERRPSAARHDHGRTVLWRGAQRHGAGDRRSPENRPDKRSGSCPFTISLPNSFIPCPEHQTTSALRTHRAEAIPACREVTGAAIAS
jgi:hypothetical protein